MPLHATDVDCEKVLQELDQLITNKSEYHKQKELRLQRLKKSLNSAPDAASRYDICNKIFHEYVHYQADSAFAYILRKEALLPQVDNAEARSEIAINRAQVLGVRGMYGEVRPLLDGLDTRSMSAELRNYYYRTYYHYYDWVSDLVTYVPEKKKFQAYTDLYRDSILLSEAPSIDRDIIQAEKFVAGGRSAEALNILHSLLDRQPSQRQLTYIYYTTSAAYESADERQQRIYYLAKTAIEDLRLSIREYASLQKLAYLMYEEGDIDRAYRYLDCSMTDAVACGANLRSFEVAHFFPIIDRTYRSQVQRRQQSYRNSLIIVSALLIILVAVILYLYYSKRALSRTRRSLTEAVEQLNAVNEELAQTGKIKEVYIARYLDRCVNYLDQFEQYRRSLAKLAMGLRVEELYKQIKSDEFIRQERKAFYTEFDKAFLEIFPHFIDNFNALLTDDKRVYPKSGDLLNTELRIFALIRLGVTDSNRIAHFLGYSLATVYNYRSKMRNRAVGDKDLFEKQVMKI
jgi:DNA-binding CsgD family transcriptional regulator